LPVFLYRNLADNPAIQTGEGNAVGDLQSAIAFTARVTREYFARHYLGDLDNCINHAIVARHILKSTFAIEEVLVGGHAGWQYGRGAYDPVTCEDHRGTVYHCTAGGNFSGHAWVEVAGLIFGPTLYQLPAKIVLADRADNHRSRITHDFGAWTVAGEPSLSAKTCSPGWSVVASAAGKQRFADARGHAADIRLR
jgi:hypothetical protein